MRSMNCVQIFVHKRSISAVKRVEFVSDGMTYIVLRCRWCHSISELSCLNRDEIYDVKDRFYEKLDRVFDKFPR
jgi:hypothetical protein